MTSLDWKIHAISAGAMGMLNLSKNSIKKHHIYFSSLAPEVLDESNKNKYLSLRGAQLTYAAPILKIKISKQLVDKLNCL